MDHLQIFFVSMWGLNMCTAITFQSGHHYFGRNLDLEYHYDESVTITPRNYPFRFREGHEIVTHHAMIGIATIAEGYPLYYDATNEYGLSMAGLNFPGYAVYHPVSDTLNNIAPFEFIPWILGQCQTVFEAEHLIKQTNLTDIPFSPAYPLSPLHWIIADKLRSISVEPIQTGLKIYENPVGVLTNNPPFDFHMNNLANYLNLSSNEPRAYFASQLPVCLYSRGLGAFGLPGDLSSASRFVRASFCKLNAECDVDEYSSVNQFFHILGSVEQTKGCCRTPDGLERTIYSSCSNTDTCVYYYTTYENRQITAVNMRHTNIRGSTLELFPLRFSTNVVYEN